MTIRYNFGKGRRLRLKRDFDRVFARRCSLADARLVIYADRNDLAATRIGISVSKRLGGAVARNRIKRLIREAFRLAQHELPGGIDVICVARLAPDATVADYQESLRTLFGKLVTRLERSKNTGGPGAPPRLGVGD